eukprot:PhF_6_TR31131/c0_g1_i3/m.45577
MAYDYIPGPSANDRGSQDSPFYVGIWITFGVIALGISVVIACFGSDRYIAFLRQASSWKIVHKCYVVLTSIFFVLTASLYFAMQPKFCCGPQPLPELASKTWTMTWGSWTSLCIPDNSYYTKTPCVSWNDWNSVSFSTANEVDITNVFSQECTNQPRVRHSPIVVTFFVWNIVLCACLAVAMVFPFLRGLSSSSYHKGWSVFAAVVFCMCGVSLELERQAWQTAVYLQEVTPMRSNQCSSSGVDCGPSDVYCSYKYNQTIYQSRLLVFRYYNSNFLSSAVSYHRAYGTFLVMIMSILLLPVFFGAIQFYKQKQEERMIRQRLMMKSSSNALHEDSYGNFLQPLRAQDETIYELSGMK